MLLTYFDIESCGIIVCVLIMVSLLKIKYNYSSLNDLDSTTAKSIDNYRKDLKDTYIAYSGTVTVNEPNDYVRIDGPNIWIEYSCQASRDFPGTVHPHSVLRDPPYGLIFCIEHILHRFASTHGFVRHAMYGSLILFDLRSKTKLLCSLDDFILRSCF
jgi:hypothetical protein